MSNPSVYRRPSLSAVTKRADLTPPPQSSPARFGPDQSNHSPGTGLYTVNSLSSYSFGSVHYSPTTLQPVDPLSRPDPDDDPEACISHIDVTPRPSVTGYDENDETTGSNALESFGKHMRSKRRANGGTFGHGELDPGIFNPDPSRGRSSDATSHRTFGTSSASASVTSLSSVDPRDTHTSQRSASTRHTSAANTDEENPQLSSDEYDDEYYDDEDDDEDDPAYRIEISSAVYNDNPSEEFDGWNGFGSGPSRSHLSYEGRRGSLPMAIPGVDEGVRERDRESSLLALRRPSRSLDDDTLSLTFQAGVSGSGSGAVDPLAHSAPGSESDWRSIGNARRARGSVSTMSTVQDTRLNNITPVASRAYQDVTDDFDTDFLNMLRGGITSLPSSDFLRSSGQDELSHMKSSIFGPRRPSAASSVLTYDDSFLKAVGKWDQTGYGVQRREWTFKREMADGSGPYHPKPPSAGSKLAGILGSRIAVDRDKVGLSSMTSSKSSSRSLAVNIEDKEREREKDRRSPANWRGMAIGSGEVWCNALIGRYEVNRTTSTRTSHFTR